MVTPSIYLVLFYVLQFSVINAWGITMDGNTLHILVTVLCVTVLGN